VVLYLLICSTFAWHNEMCMSYFGSGISLPRLLALHVPLALKIARSSQGKEGAFVQDCVTAALQSGKFSVAVRTGCERI